MAKFSDRGFGEYGEGIDTHGFKWRVKESSIAGDPHCWLFVEDDRSRPGSLHLHYTQVLVLIEQIAKFPDANADPHGVHSYGSGICRYGVKWELRDVSSDLPRLGIRLEGVISGGGPVEERTVNSRLFLSVEQAATLKLHFEAFIEHALGEDHWKNSESYRRTWREGEGSEAE